jgi:hypothetical protein
MYSGQRLLGGASSAAASVEVDVPLAAKLRMGTWLLPEDRFGRAYEIAGRLRGSDMSYKRFLSFDAAAYAASVCGHSDVGVLLAGQRISPAERYAHE